MTNRVLYSLLFLSLHFNAFSGGFDVKTSSVIQQPDVKVLGDFNGSWYMLGFEKPGNLNKPPQYRILKYAQGFGSSKTSKLYPSFGEKTYYLCAAFINNKVSLFYSKCEKREDEESMMDAREGRKHLPVIMRQDFDPNTLEADGGTKVVFDEIDERFTASGMMFAESEDKSKTAILFKCFYRQQKFKVWIIDNKTGKEFSRTVDFKESKENLQFLSVQINNQGTVYVSAKLRTDIISAAPSTGPKFQNKYYLYAINIDDEKPKQLTLLSPIGKDQFLENPITNVLSGGELVVAFSSFSDEKHLLFKGFSVTVYDAELNVKGKREITPDAKFAEDAGAYHGLKKGKEFSNLTLHQIVPLPDKSFMLITEYKDTVFSTSKNTPPSVERDYIVTFRLDESVNIKYQQFIPKKQISPTLGYAFSIRSFRKGTDVLLFYNSDWEADGDHDMNLQCTTIPGNGNATITQKVLNTSNDFFTNVVEFIPPSGNKVLFAVEKLVDFGEISREVKLLEVTVK
jgi:hypothetical protein